MQPTTTCVLFELNLLRFRPYGKLIYVQVYDTTANHTALTVESVGYDDTSNQMPLFVRWIITGLSTSTTYTFTPRIKTNGNYAYWYSGSTGYHSFTATELNAAADTSSIGLLVNGSDPDGGGS